MVEHNGTENYRGTEIKWEMSEIAGSGFWRGTAAIVTPPGEWSPPEVRTVPDIPERFNSEEDARESVLRLAREVVDGRSSRAVKVSRLSAGSDVTNRLGNYSSRSHGPEIATRASVCLILIAALLLVAGFFDYSSPARN